MSLLTCEDIIAAIPDVYQKGYNDGLPDPVEGYTFPDGTPYSDIVNLVGDDTITDETYGGALYWRALEESTTQSNLQVYLLMNDGAEHIIGTTGLGNNWKITSCKLGRVTQLTNGRQGRVYLSAVFTRITDGATSSGGVSQYTSDWLKGFGVTGNTFSVENKG